MKTISLRVEDGTVEILERKAEEQDITISEYLRKQIFPLIEGTKPLSLEQCLAKLESCLSRLHFCVKPLQEFAFDLQKFETELVVKQEMAPEIEKTPIKEEKEPNEQSQTEPETVATSS